MESCLDCKNHEECIGPEDDFPEEELRKWEFHDEVFNTVTKGDTGIYEDRSAMRPNLELARKLKKRNDKIKFVNNTSTIIKEISNTIELINQTQSWKSGTVVAAREALYRHIEHLTFLLKEEKIMLDNGY